MGKFYFTSNEARYFTICGSILFHVLRQQNISLTYYRPTVHKKGVTHYTLQGKVCEKEYGQKHPYSFFLFRVEVTLLYGRCPFGAFLFYKVFPLSLTLASPELKAQILPSFVLTIRLAFSSISIATPQTTLSPT